MTRLVLIEYFNYSLLQSIRRFGQQEQGNGSQGAINTSFLGIPVVYLGHTNSMRQRRIFRDVKENHEIKEELFKHP